MRMRQANKSLIARGGLGGTVESGNGVPKKTAVNVIFKDALEGGAEGNKGADGNDVWESGAAGMWNESTSA